MPPRTHDNPHHHNTPKHTENHGIRQERAPILLDFQTSRRLIAPVVPQSITIGRNI